MNPNPFTKQGKGKGKVCEMIDSRQMVRGFKTIPNSAPV